MLTDEEFVISANKAFERLITGVRPIPANHYQTFLKMSPAKSLTLFKRILRMQKRLLKRIVPGQTISLQRPNFYPTFLCIRYAFEGRLFFPGRHRCHLAKPTGPSPDAKMEWEYSRWLVARMSLLERAVREVLGVVIADSEPIRLNLVRWPEKPSPGFLSPVVQLDLKLGDELETLTS